MNKIYTPIIENKKKYQFSNSNTFSLYWYTNKMMISYSTNYSTDNTIAKVNYIAITIMAIIKNGHILLMETQKYS